MEQHIINYNGKEYIVAEPTIMVWNKLASSQSLENGEKFRYTLISTATGLSEDEIRQADWFDVFKVSEYLTDYYMEQSPKFYPTFNFNGVDYKFVDFDKLTFGEFVDIDTFLTQPTTYRMANMNMLMALLYREVSDSGKIEKYDGEKTQARAELFRHLPAKYLQGSLFFLTTLESTCSVLMSGSLVKKMKMKLSLKLNRIKIKLLSSVGVGIVQSYTWLVKTSTRLKKWWKNH